MRDPATYPDVIDHLVGIAPGSRLDAVRAARPQARDNAQASFLALFAPAETDAMSVAERFALAVFVAGLHRAGPETAFYAAELARAAGPALVETVERIAAAAAAEGPAGRFPDGPLTSESTPGPTFRVPDGPGGVPAGRLAAAFAHAHMLVFRPREAAPGDVQALLDAGWSTTGIVTLSQLVSFLGFQLRVVAGLRVLAASIARPGRAA